MVEPNPWVKLEFHVVLNEILSYSWKNKRFHVSCLLHGKGNEFDPQLPIWWHPNTSDRQHTPISHTPSNPPGPNYERIPWFSLLVKVAWGCVPVRCVETTLEYSSFKKMGTLLKAKEPFFKAKGSLINSLGWNDVSTIVRWFKRTELIEIENLWGSSGTLRAPQKKSARRFKKKTVFSQWRWLRWLSIAHLPSRGDGNPKNRQWLECSSQVPGQHIHWTWSCVILDHLGCFNYDKGELWQFWCVKTIQHEGLEFLFCLSLLTGQHQADRRGCRCFIKSRPLGVTNHGLVDLC